MKNLIIIAVLFCSASMFAQNFNLSLQAEYGGNYAIVDENPLTGINSTIRGTIQYPLESGFSLELSAGVGYTSLSNTFKSTVGQVGFGFNQSNILSAGLLVQFMDKSDALSSGGYAQFNIPVADKVDIIARGSLVVNVLELQNNPTVAQGSVGVKYNF